ncbi:MAG: OmpH family outer membrane protein [Bacteroidetes bacterium]|nr:OmpH family outer membrane protein [Bacteroidota bacterium]
MMRNLVKIIALVVFVTGVTTINAQNKTKLGHIDFGKLIEQLPGQDTVKTSMAKYAQSLQDQYQSMQSELQSKIDDYTKNKETFSALIKQTKEKEIADLQSRMEAFQQSAQQDMSDQESKLSAPFIEKAKKAIQDVAKENGFSYVFNSVEGLLLFTEGGEDIMPLVKKKLGIQ